MMRRPAFAINDGVNVTGATLPELPDLNVDLAATEHRVVGWGADAARYRHFLAAGLAATADDGDAPALDAGQVRTVAVLAAWRAGAVRFRDDALQRAASVAESRARAALGLGDVSVEAFLAAQRESPFGDPRGGGTIALLGGFRGLGGTWLSPPVEPIPLGAATFAVRTGSERWQITADLFGARISRLERDPAASAPGASLAVLRTSPDSYLATLERP
jgi:hypothetical protein